MPSLKWGPQYEIEHLELFAGDCSVTRGEFEDAYGIRVQLVAK
jgi:hypothetical protein